jgi:hypothetical protein
MPQGFWSQWTQVGTDFVHKSNKTKIAAKPTTICTMQGCTNPAINAAIPGHTFRCIKHSKLKCSTEFCDTPAVKKGLCTKHGAYGTCATSECDTSAWSSHGFCFKHDKKVPEKGACKEPGCTTSKQNGLSGYCKKHSSSVSLCTYPGCSNQNHTGGFCMRHKDGILGSQLLRLWPQMKPMAEFATSFADWTIYAQGISE